MPPNLPALYFFTYLISIAVYPLMGKIQSGDPENIAVWYLRIVLTFPRGDMKYPFLIPCAFAAGFFIVL
jgi:hypothetical protein